MVEITTDIMASVLAATYHALKNIACYTEVNSTHILSTLLETRVNVVKFHYVN